MVKELEEVDDDFDVAAQTVADSLLRTHGHSYLRKRGPKLALEDMEVDHPKLDFGNHNPAKLVREGYTIAINSQPITFEGDN